MQQRDAEHTVAFLVHTHNTCDSCSTWQGVSSDTKMLMNSPFQTFRPLPVTAVGRVLRFLMAY